ncbi:MAG: 1-acyl-sn-glycerol-3-phosphate acyltransferase [Chloroflexi bacterium]|nr:1-acyl-sn-glycerol-3-phosphate acyltransferase [Chloroflexota bacterium]
MSRARTAVLFVIALAALAAGLAGHALRHRARHDAVFTMWRPMYFFFVSLFRILFRLSGGITIIGRENLPAAGAYIVVANHVSYIDPPVVGAALPRPAYYMAKAELFEAKPFGAAIPWVGAYPVKRGVADRAAMKRTLDLLAGGEIVVIFPEGTRRPVGDLGEAESGFGWIATKTDVPIIPIGISGSAALFPRGAKTTRRARVTVRIGSPMALDELRSSPDTRRAIKEIGAETMKRIGELIGAG